MTSNRHLDAKHHNLTEPAVDHYFLKLVDRYSRTIPSWQAESLKQATDLLLPPRWTLSPLDQIKVANLLWEHDGSAFETGYRLKEDLKRCLRCNTPSERVKLMQALGENGNGDVKESFQRLIRSM